VTQFAMVIDLNRCIGCHTCSVSCKAKYGVPADQGRAWVKRLGPAKTSEGISHTFYPGLCNQCGRPECVDVCPVPPISVQSTDLQSGRTVIQEAAATWKDALTGIVLNDRDRCIGCGACVEACPYGARYLNPVSGENRKVDKCDFCIELLAQGIQPFCVETCIANARIFGDLEDRTSEVARYIERGAVQLSSRQVNLNPNVFYYGRKKDIVLLQKTSIPQRKT